jgi:hypothetical protein
MHQHLHHPGLHGIIKCDQRIIQAIPAADQWSNVQPFLGQGAQGPQWEPRMRGLAVMVDQHDGSTRAHNDLERGQLQGYFVFPWKLVKKESKSFFRLCTKVS